jgi:outer membrane protein OmpA-like peptidoglycan-associated protein
MPEPAEHRAATLNTGPEANGTELAQLRRLLVGQELDELAKLKALLADPAWRTSAVAQVLPDAIKAARTRALRDALEPIFERAFHNSVRKHPKELADAIYPVIGPAIRNLIGAAIRGYAEGLNQIIEKSASFRAIRWRIEARLTGKPFTEILLARSLLYSVEQVFLIHRASGLLLLHVSGPTSVLKDADMISGMLTAIQDFFSDSFTEAGQNLETVDAGSFKLWIQYGSKAVLVGAVSGTAPAALKEVFQKTLDRIHELLYAELDTFKQEDLSVFEPARPYLEACLLGHPIRQRRRRLVLRWLLVTVVVVLPLAAWIFQTVRQQARWDRYLNALKQQSGIIVARVDKQGSRYLIAGLKDPSAPDPAVLLRNEGLDPGQVRYAWQPYLSLNTPFAVERDLEAAKRQIESEIVRFENGSPKLLLAEAGHLEGFAVAINRLLRVRPNSRVVVTGHTDEVGSSEANSELSYQRAVNVITALSAQGVPPGALQPFGAGNIQPLRTGSTDWDRAFNRSVSFRVVQDPGSGSPPP